MLGTTPPGEVDDEQTGWSPRVWLILVALPFIPAAGIAVIYYGLLRLWHQRVVVIALFSGLVSLIALLVGATMGAWPLAVGYVSGLPSGVGAWRDLIPVYVIVNLWIGGVAGTAVAALQAHQLRDNPHMTEMKGAWQYKFRYARTPWEAWGRRRDIAALKSGAAATPDTTPLGLDVDTDQVVRRYNDEIPLHTFISGAPGSGKTVTMLNCIHHDIAYRTPVVIADFKGSPELSAKVEAWASRYGADFYHFLGGQDTHMPGRAFYDPLRNAGNGAPDMMLGMREYDTSAAVYKDNMRQLLQGLFAMMGSCDRDIADTYAAAPPDKGEQGSTGRVSGIDWNHGGMAQLASVLAGGASFGSLVAGCENTPVQDDAQALYDQIFARRQMSPLRHVFEELAGSMRTLMVSNAYGHWLRPAPGDRVIDLYTLTQPGSHGVVLFSLNADSEPDFVRLVGSLIFADLTNVSNKRRQAQSHNLVSVYADEFQAVPPTAVKSMLEKSRASHMGMTCSAQSFEQIVTAADSPAAGASYLTSFMDEVSTFIIHAGATETSAERLAEILGKSKHQVYRQAYENKGFLFSFNWSRRRNQTVQASSEDDWDVPPSEFMSLSTPSRGLTTAMVVKKSPHDPELKGKPGAVARKVQMVPHNSVIREEPDIAPYVDTDDTEADTDTSGQASDDDADWGFVGDPPNEDDDEDDDEDDESESEGEGARHMDADMDMPDLQPPPTPTRPLPRVGHSTTLDGSAWEKGFIPDSRPRSAQTPPPPWNIGDDGEDDGEDDSPLPELG